MFHAEYMPNEYSDQVLRKVLFQAASHTLEQTLLHSPVSTLHVLLAIVREGDSAGRDLLVKLGVDMDALFTAVKTKADQLALLQTTTEDRGEMSLFSKPLESALRKAEECYGMLSTRTLVAAFVDLAFVIGVKVECMEGGLEQKEYSLAGVVLREFLDENVKRINDLIISS